MITTISTSPFVATSYPHRLHPSTARSLCKTSIVGVKGAAHTASEYKESWVDALPAYYLSKKLQEVTGFNNNKYGFESLVEVSADASRALNPLMQRELVLQALHNAIPHVIPFMVRNLLPQSRFSRECFAVFTRMFFVWLIGECEIMESEVNGRKEKNVVRIKKCRLLDNTNCVGICTNMCKIPTQKYMKESMAMPVNMTPNFEDMSCEMIFGEEAPTLKQDKALNHPCFTSCKLKKKAGNFVCGI